MPTTPPNATARRLATARKIKGLMGENDTSQTRLGEVIGLTQGSVSKLLTGERPFNVDQLEDIAAFFDVDITDLLPPVRETPGQGAEIRNRWSSSPDAAPELASV